MPKSCRAATVTPKNFRTSPLTAGLPDFFFVFR